MKNYKSELINKILEERGHEMSALHYESECIETWINEVKGAYPKLTDYESEWMNYITQNPVGEFPYETITDVADATVDNVVPYAYKSVILKGKTDENLQSVKMPVLTTTGKNLFDGKLELGSIVSSTGDNTPSADNVRSVGYIKVKPDTSIVLSNNLKYTNSIIYEYDSNKNYIGRQRTNPFTTSANCHYIRFRSDAKQSNLDVKYQVEYGTAATPYEPYKSNILTVNEDVELRGIGDVKDTIDCLTGQMTVRIREVVLDGSQGWAIHAV